MKKHKTICANCGRMHEFGKTCQCVKEMRNLKAKQARRDGRDEATKFYKSAKWRKKRAFIIKRDLGHCQRCKNKYNIINGERLEVHHIKSRHQFPELAFEDSNLITLCKTCNLQLGTSNKLDFDYLPKNIEFNLG